MKLPIGLTGVVLAASAAALLAACKEQPPGAGPGAEHEAKALARAAKETAVELAQKAKETTSKAGDQIAAGAEKVGEKAGPLLDRMGDRLKEAGQKLDHDTQDERDTAARETREALDDLKNWFKEDAKPAAEKNTEKLKGEIRDLADDIEAKLDKAGKQTGKAADKTHSEIRDDLDKLRAKLKEAKDRGLE
jgi:ElaB/YqjD/DUF883 family membrane-anchored ribosome-binding protein